MANAKDPKTDRELLLYAVDRIGHVSESVERIAKALESLETNKIAGHENRITKLEKWKSEWGGALKVGVVLLIIFELLRYVLEWT